MNSKYKNIWDDTALKYSEIWGNNIIQIAIYNTSISEKGNMVIVLKDDSMSQIVKAHKVTKKVIRKNIEPPLVISPDYISSSLDSFPLEFLNIKTDYYSIKANEDHFCQLEFEKKYIRLQAERDLKGKELLIKMAVLDNYSNIKMLRELIKVSIKSIEPILKGVLFLLDENIPYGHELLIKTADEATDFDISSLLAAVHFTNGTIKMSDGEVYTFFTEYTEQLRTLCAFIEKL